MNDNAGTFLGFLNTLGVPLNRAVHKIKKTIQVPDSNSERSVKGGQEYLPLLLHPPNSQMTSSLTASLLRLFHSLLHYKTGRNSASRHHSFCPFQFIAGVPPTQAPSWQPLLPEDFGKNLGNLSRALQHSLEKNKVGNVVSITPLATISSTLYKNHRWTKL